MLVTDRITPNYIPRPHPPPNQGYDFRDQIKRSYFSQEKMVSSGLHYWLLQKQIVIKGPPRLILSSALGGYNLVGTLCVAGGGGVGLD